MDWSSCTAVERNANKMSGAWIFKGTRIPVSTFFANLEDGATTDDFLEWFPGVTRLQLTEVLAFASASLEPKAA